MDGKISSTTVESSRNKEDASESYISDVMRTSRKGPNMADDLQSFGSWKEYIRNFDATLEIPLKVQVALEVIGTHHDNRVTTVAFDVIYNYLKEEENV